MVNIWFSSDPHYGHASIIEYCSRPFKDATEMGEVMIQRHNALVRPQDHWYCLGDVAVSQQVLNAVLPRLNGHKRLVLGNHDNHAPMTDYAKYFKKIMLWRKFEDIIFTHVPIMPANFPGNARYNVHGYIHEKPAMPGPYMNVSVEQTSYAPISLEDVKAWVHKHCEPRIIADYATTRKERG